MKSSSKKLIAMHPKLVKRVQDYANKNYEGNFNLAVRKLLEQSLPA